MTKNDNLQNKAIRAAVEKLNQGYSMEYVYQQIQKQFGIFISLEELNNHPDLLPKQKRKQNAWDIISEDLDDRGNLSHLTINEIQYKFGFDPVEQKILCFAYTIGLQKGQRNVHQKMMRDLHWLSRK